MNFTLNESPFKFTLYSKSKKVIFVKVDSFYLMMGLFKITFFIEREF